MSWILRKRVVKDIRFAQVHEVHKDGLLSSFSENLRWSHNGTSPLCGQLWVVLSQDVEHPP